jgi:hypothetical protein
MRAKAINRSGVERRPEEFQVDPELIKKLVQKAAALTLLGITFSDRAERVRRLEDGIAAERFKDELISTIQHYRQRALADNQERPARMAAALKPGLKLARELLEWLNSLPMGVLIELQAGGIKTSLEAFIPRTENRVAYWQRHVAANRPAGKGAASLDLRKSLTDIITAHQPDPPNATGEQKRYNEQKRDRWVAFACTQVGARFPNEKKNRGRFRGEQKHPRKRRPKLYLRPHRKSADERRLKRRLKDVPI